MAFGHDRTALARCSTSTGFKLPNDAIRSPDAAWVHQPRLDALSDDERQQYLLLCPDFVVELRSGTDRLPTLQAKMEAYRAHGARLGWLIGSLEKQVHVYLPGTEPEVLTAPQAVRGEPVLPGFVLDLTRIWNAD